ncbi:hypothetical protein LUZ63_006957 [Rhynchospora breviuscula]|uniref:Cysteine-rich receptor-like protein kinase 10 n=1 Tax=Rhynchospora breviuscula TaxID=2022672 RepID=A0A9Q0HUK4_9POAL|nr:hypothetical protein LUZ63_006957 [Rhynchospora breviuscula]
MKIMTLVSLKLKPLASLYSLLVFAIFLPSTAQLFPYVNCSTTSNFTDNSTFKSNLNLLFSTLYTSVIPSGFSNQTKGQYPNQVFGLVLCRVDLSSSDCQTCLNTSITEIVSECPHSKQACIWFDNCTLRYSYKNFFSKADSSEKFGYYDPSNAAWQPLLFNDSLSSLIGTLSRKAAYDNPRLYAAGQVEYTTGKIYGLVQCTRDLTSNECYRCLQDCAEEILSPERKGSVQWFIVTYSCNVHYELYLFYDESITGNSMPPALAPSATTSKSPTIGSSGIQHKILIVSILLVSAIFIVFAVAFLYLRRRKRMKSLWFIAEDEEVRYFQSLLLDLTILKDATNNFSNDNKLGEGGFGPVYKGKLRGTEIAVKRLSQSSKQGLLELRNEVAFVAKVQHKNLVKLLGFCLEKQEKLLVYEYLSNLSLDKIIFDRARREQLDWDTRYRIIKGIGEGLLYLHDDSRLKIIHRDLKPSNILLDENMNPKISDFGLAKLFDQDVTQGCTSRVAGTYGYMAPEYVLHGHFSVKSDVFSYGVMVLEIVTGIKSATVQECSTTSQESENSDHLITYVWRCWNRGRALQVLDDCLVGQCHLEDVSRCIHIALLCVQRNPIERPTMATVMLMLSNQSAILPKPLIPAFAIQSGTNITTEEYQKGNTDSRPSTAFNSIYSVNVISKSEIVPR